MWIEHNPARYALTAGGTDRTGARLGLSAVATPTVSRRAAVMTSLLGHDLLLMLESQHFGMGKAQSRTGD